MPNEFDWDELASEAKVRKLVADGGLEVLLCSRPFGLTGEGESSMISTQPDEFSAGVRVFSSLSVLRREAAGRSSGNLMCDDCPLPAKLVDFEFEEDMVETGGLGRLVLPIRSRGTRVWIFCSRFLTFARISDTICTPRFLEVVVAAPPAVVEAVDELAVCCEVERLTIVLDRIREGVANEGRVVDLPRDVGDWDEVILCRGKEKPARWSKADCPASESVDDVDGLGRSETDRGRFDSGVKSGRSRSEGG